MAGSSHPENRARSCTEHVERNEHGIKLWPQKYIPSLAKAVGVTETDLAVAAGKISPSAAVSAPEPDGFDLYVEREDGGTTRIGYFDRDHLKLMLAMVASAQKLQACEITGRESLDMRTTMSDESESRSAREIYDEIIRMLEAAREDEQAAD